MTNRYPGQCNVCGRNVEAGEGLIANENGRWVVWHKDCEAAPAPRVRKADGKIEKPRVSAAPQYVQGNSYGVSVPRDRFPRIVELLETARANGQKYPSIDFDLPDGPGILACCRIQIRLAGEKSKNPGSVTVTDGRRYPNNTYYGRIATDGTWFASRGIAADGRGADELASFLRDLNDDPAKFAGEYGRKTGNCCFCATEITHESSLTVGYGPICADRFGLPHGGY